MGTDNDFGQQASCGEPRFKHDCSACVFLGHWLGSDLYVCSASCTRIAGWTNCIARYGDKGHLYTSLSMSTDAWNEEYAKGGTVRQSVPGVLLEAWRRWYTMHLNNDCEGATAREEN